MFSSWLLAQSVAEGAQLGTQGWSSLTTSSTLLLLGWEACSEREMG